MDAAVERFSIPKSLRSFRDLDFFTSNVKLKYRGGRGYQTISGGFITLLFYGLIAFAAVYYCFKFFDTTEPKVTEKVYRSHSAFTVDLVKERFHMFFFAREKDNFISADNFLRLFDIKASIITTSYNLNSTDIVAHDTKIDTNPCRNSYWLNDKELNQSFSKGSHLFLKTRAVCSNSTSLPIYGMYTETKSSRVRY